MKKLHFLSVKLRQWNKDHFGVQEHRLRRIESDIADTERKQEAGDLSDLERNTLKGLIRDQWQCTKHLESIWRQKSRQSLYQTFREYLPAKSLDRVGII